MSRMQDDAENIETVPLDDPDERVWVRIEKGLEPNLSYDEFMYFRMEHALKELAKKKHWVTGHSLSRLDAA